jgi:hypothetical protein
MRDKRLEVWLLNQLDAVNRQPFVHEPPLGPRLADIISGIAHWTSPDTDWILKLTSRAWKDVVHSNSSTHIGIWNR